MIKGIVASWSLKLITLVHLAISKALSPVLRVGIWVVQLMRLLMDLIAPPVVQEQCMSALRFPLM